MTIVMLILAAWLLTLAVLVLWLGPLVDRWRPRPAWEGAQQVADLTNLHCNKE